MHILKENPKYGNCLQLWAVIVFAFYLAKHQINMPFIIKTRIRKLPMIVGRFRIWTLTCKASKCINFVKENQITEFRTWFSQQKTKKMRFAMEKPTNVGIFRICILASKTSKYMRFTLENPYTETVYIGRQFQCLNFNHQKTKKHALCNEKPEYGNCLQL